MELAPFIRPLIRPLKLTAESQKHRGQSLVELALMLPVLVLIMAGAIDFGRVMYGYVAVSSAVQAGAEYAARTQDFDATDIDSVVMSESGGFLTSNNLAMDGVQFCSPSQDICPTLHSYLVRVTATYTFSPILTSLLPNGPTPISIQVQAAAPIAVK